MPARKRLDVRNLKAKKIPPNVARLELIRTGVIPFNQEVYRGLTDDPYGAGGRRFNPDDI